jgi:hypothetical protein
MKNGKSKDFTCFLRDCRCSGRQTVGNGSPFNPVFYSPLLRRWNALTVNIFRAPHAFCNLLLLDAQHRLWLASVCTF